MRFLPKAPSVPIHASSTFINPPMDGSLTVPEIYDFHYQNNPSHTVFRYIDVGGKPVDLSYSDVVPAAHNAARLVATRADINLEIPGAKPIIAMLATSDTITYFTTVIGILRADITLLLVSPRNSAAAVAHLLAKLRPSHILTSREKSIRELAQSSLEILGESKDSWFPATIAMPVYEEIYLSGTVHVPLPSRHRDLSAATLVLHSSGTTSFPKMIPWTDAFYLQLAMAPLFGAQNLCGEVFACHSLAVFHGIAMAFMGALASAGFTMATFRPASPSLTPTPEAVWKGALSVSPQYLFGPPVFFERWSRDHSKLSFFKALKGIVFGGAHLQKAAGDYLAKEGIPIYSLYGSTEGGIFVTMLPENPGLDWEYMPISPHCSGKFIPQGDGTYEFVLISRPTSELMLLNTTLNGEDAYATNDLLVPHPSLPNRWKIIGRKDDQIMLNTGEKTNPGPLETILCQHPKVSSAVMFGRGRPQNGVLIEVEGEYAFDPSDLKKLQDFKADIWPWVERTNLFAPAHSRLFKEMVLVAHPLKPFGRNQKGIPKRFEVLEDYNDEINTAYASIEQGIQITPPKEWSAENTLTFVRNIVNDVLRRPVKDTEDLFEHGCDSLQATWIQQSLVFALGSTALKITLPSNFVYEHPSIDALARNMLLLIAEPHAVLGTTRSSLENIVESCVTAFPDHAPEITINEGVWRTVPAYDIVLITGTTGSLGSATLARLAASSSVSKIYALNRRSRQNITILERQEYALALRGYDAGVANSDKVVLIEGELTRDGLQIDPLLREEIRKSITHIVHIGWRVDFNLSISSFEPAIRGVRGLIDLALSSPHESPPRLIFTSSVGLFRNIHTRSLIPEAPIEDANVPIGQGYSESKWAVERILSEAAKYTSLRPIAVRIGQISGGLNGAWNTSDWVPAIVKSSLKIRALPDLKGTCSWIPLDLAAEALVDFCSAEPRAGTVHLLHPQPLTCRDIFEVFSQELSLPLQPLAMWVNTLQDLTRLAPGAGASEENNRLLDDLPAAKLLDFFKRAVENEDDMKDGLGIPNFAIDEALAASGALRTQGRARKIAPDDVRLWLKYWKSVGFI